MARRSRSKQADDANNTEQSYEEHGAGQARPSGTGRRRNVAPGAQEFEAEDYDEENRRNVGGEGGPGIQTGTYEDDYGPGAQGLRQPGFQTEPSARSKAEVLRRGRGGGTDQEDFPSGVWSTRKTNARLAQVKSRRMAARPQAGRGVGVKKKPARGRGSKVRPRKVSPPRVRRSVRDPKS